MKIDKETIFKKLIIIQEKLKIFYSPLRKFFIVVFLLLVFFYSFWFSLSEDKFKNFILSQAKVFLNEKVTIENSKKGWCGFQLLNIKGESVVLEKLKVNFCSFKFFTLQGINLVLSFKGGDIFITFPILKQKTEILISPNFDLNEFPILSNYIGFRGKPIHFLKIEIAKNENLEINTLLSAEEVIIEKEKIQPAFIRGFLPDAIYFKKIDFEGYTLDEKTNISLKTEGFFQGNITGLIANEGNFLQSKISLKLIGNFSDLEKVTPLVKSFLQPYLEGNKLQIKLGGTLRNLKPEKI